MLAPDRDRWHKIWCEYTGFIHQPPNRGFGAYLAP